MLAPLILSLLIAQAPAQPTLSFEDALKEFRTATPRGLNNDAKTMAVIERIGNEIDFNTLDQKQVSTLCMYGFSLDGEIRNKILGRLDALPAPTNADKARIAYTRLLAEYSTPQAGDALRAALAEPGTGDLLNSPESGSVFYALFASMKIDKAHMADNFERTLDWLQKTNVLYGWDHGVMSMFYDWARTDLPNDTELLARIRRVCGDLDKRTLNQGKVSSDDRQRIELDYEAFTGPALNGTLIGHKSPEIEFRWCTDPSVHKLSDLVGRVVVLDFWTTWCKPCVAAFPHIRELVDHYKGQPITFVGVTSIQGADYDPDGTINCKGDPAKEIGLMPVFMKKKDMTWTVAFSTKDAFDPSFGVHSIPHMAIIDSHGVVRYNELRPELTSEQFEALIDPLIGQASRQKLK